MLALGAPQTICSAFGNSHGRFSEPERDVARVMSVWIVFFAKMEKPAKSNSQTLAQEAGKAAF